MRNNVIRMSLGMLFYLFMHAAGAVGFIATVEDNTVSFGQSIQLKLQLEDAKARGPIDLSSLAKDFLIYSQNQFSTYSNVNGVVQSESGWHVTLMPKNVGEFTIPAISIDTDKGSLKTTEIKISVLHVKAVNSGSNDPVGISLVSTINKAKALVNEPVIYTLKIISYKPIANVVLEDIKSNDAIVEKIGEPKQYDQTHGGVRAHIIEIRYAITALRPGKIELASATMHGELQVPTQPQRSQRFSIFGNMFMDNMFELKPFSLQSEAITIDVLPSKGGTSLLPLLKLTITQNWDAPQEIKVGDTITRKVKIVAKGGFAKQLPSVKDFMPQDKVKIYANKPSFVDNFEASSETIVGIREEEYSIVPQQAGTITFPEIQIKWWNLSTKKFEVTTLPAKTLQVAASASNVAPGVTLDYSDNEQPQPIEIPAPTAEQDKPTMLYAIIGGLVGIIITLGLVLLFIVLKKRPVKIKKLKSDKAIVIKTVHDLRKHILQYAVKNWHVQANVTLNRLGDALANNNYSYNIELYSTLSQYINAEIYANVAIDLDLMLAQWEEFKRSVIKNKFVEDLHEANEDYSSLNPT